MSDLGIEVFTVATRTHTDYLPLSSLPPGTVPAHRLERESRGIPPEHLMLAAADDAVDVAGEPDVSAMALAALGGADSGQPLYLVRGPLRDSMVAALAGLVHGSGWQGEDLGITQLGDLGGTEVFALLDWAVPAGLGATVVICDEPLVADARLGAGRFAAVGLRLRRGPGPLRVLDCGEGRTPVQAAHRFGGGGPCDAWLDLHDALTAGRIADGERVLLGVRTPVHEGWLLLEAAGVAALRLTAGAPSAGS
jgi:hypothetical protein